MFITDGKSTHILSAIDSLVVLGPLAFNDQLISFLIRNCDQGTFWENEGNK